MGDKHNQPKHDNKPKNDDKPKKQPDPPKKHDPPPPPPKKHDPPKKAEHKPAAQRQADKPKEPARRQQEAQKPHANKPAQNRQERREADRGNKKNNNGQKKNQGQRDNKHQGNKKHHKPGRGKGKGKGKHKKPRGSGGGDADSSGGSDDGGYEEQDEYDSPSATPDVAPWDDPPEEQEAERKVIAADPDLLLQRVEGAPIELIEEMLFQAIGSLELITIMRDYSFDGQQIFYQPIENLEAINREYNPNTITNPSFNFSNWKRIHAIDDPSHIIYGSADSSGAVRLEVLPGQVNIAVVLPGLTASQLIEVAVSYSPEGIMYSPGYSGDTLYDGGMAEDEDISIFVDGGTPATVVWDYYVEGGSALTYYAIIDGGEAFSYFTGTVDGGNALGYNIDRTLIGAGA